VPRREQGVGDVKGSKFVNSYWLCVETFETDFTECNNLIIIGKPPVQLGRLPQLTVPGFVERR